MSTHVVEPELLALPPDALATATGGVSPDASMTCPAGTSPNYTLVSGNLRLTGPGGLTVPVGGGTYDRLTCDPIPGAPTTKRTPAPTGTALRPGGDR